MTNTINHDGIVESTDGSTVFVRITQTSACSSCSVKNQCSSAESKEKIIEITNTGGYPYKVGDVVMLSGQTSMGMKAVFLAFVVPFFILIVSLFASISLTGGNEVLSALVSLGLLIPYYLIIWLNKNKLKKNFSFTIKPINN